MARRRLPRTDAATLNANVLLQGEVAYDTTNNQLRIGDGATAGGKPITGSQTDVSYTVGTPGGGRGILLPDRLEFIQPGGSVTDAQLVRVATAELSAYKCNLRFQRDAHTDLAFTMYTSGEPDVKLIAYADATFAWCDPAVGYDVLLSRYGVGQLQITTAYGGAANGTLRLGQLIPTSIALGTATITPLGGNFNYNGQGSCVNNRTDGGDPSYVGEKIGVAYSQIYLGLGFGVSGGAIRFDAKIDGGALTEAMQIRDTDVRPGTDNAQTLGTAGRRWSVVYAGTGAINTSDGRQKAQRGPLSDAEVRAWGRVSPLIFQWNDAVAAKGADNARLHAGFIAQAVAEAFSAEGLDAHRYALFCEDPELATVTRKVEVTRQVIEDVEVDDEELVEKDGALVLTAIKRTERRAKTVTLPVVDQAGRPVMVVVMQARAAVLHPETGEEIEPAKPERLAPRTFEQPVMETVEIDQEHQEPTGETRMGLRYDQCLVFEAAYQRARATALEARVATLEAR